MIEILLSFDVFLFRLINQRWTHPLLDEFFVTITQAHKNPIFLYGILPVILIFWLYMDRLRGVKVMLALALTIAVSDSVSHRLIKAHFQRPRPNQVTSLTHTDLKLDYSPSGYSFTSNHAMNNFAGATVLTFAYPGLGPVLFVYAFLVAYSRPYVGVHYPSDIAAGGLLGLIIGWILYYLIFSRFLGKRKQDELS
jgi:undecaprenyl-diphosphatase